MVKTKKSCICSSKCERTYDFNTLRKDVRRRDKINVK